MDGWVNVCLSRKAVGLLINLCKDLATEGSLEFEGMKVYVEAEDSLSTALSGNDPHKHLGGFGVPCPGCGTILRYEVGMAVVECVDCNTKGRVKFSWEPEGKTE